MSPVTESTASMHRDRSRTDSNPRLSAPQLPRRRSSILSYGSLDDTRQSVTSSANDYIHPWLGSKGNRSQHDEPSHWHSSPLAFAILPAIAGLFFKDGNLFLTDLLLLGLAAIFLNWSVRLPWDWYHSAQAVVSITPPRNIGPTLDNINEEEQAVDSPTGSTTSTAPAGDDARGKTGQSSDGSNVPSDEQEEAAAQLHTHETLALLSTFVLPALAAYLLHVIRGQLSRPSTSLVSDYNLTIFLLAAEIRPCRHLIRLVTNRTLHLQRAVKGDNISLHDSKAPSLELVSRLEVLEAKLSDQTPSPALLAGQKEDMAVFQTEIKKRYEPRLEALERAVRRYEKRATTLTMLTEQRIQSLESRLQDALSLAAVAAKSSQKPTVLALILAATSRAMMVPLQAVWFVTVWPVKVVEDLLRRVSEMLFGRRTTIRRRAEPKVGKAKSYRTRDDALAGHD